MSLASVKRGSIPVEGVAMIAIFLGLWMNALTTIL